MKFKYFLTWFFMFFMGQAVLGDPTDCCTFDPDTNTTICTCPIDGGASLLVGAGVVYGMKRIRDKKKSKKDLKDTI